MRADSTLFRYLRKGQFIYLNNGTIKKKLLGLFPVEKPKQTLYKVIFKGSEWGATMEVTLEDQDTKERRVIHVDPERRVISYTKERF